MESFPKNIWHAFGRLTHRRREPRAEKAPRARNLSAAPSHQAPPVANRLGVPLDQRRVVGDDRGPMADPGQNARQHG